MSFLNPLFLFALFAVGLPLLIHLLNLRKPKKIAFSTLTFFEHLKNTTIKRLRIKKYLLLALRVAAIICLALVLARPFLPPGFAGSFNTQEPSLNGILLDNSISMERINSEGPLFEYAKEIVKMIGQASKDDDRFVLQVTNGEAESGSILSKSNLLKLLVEQNVSNTGNYTAERLQQLIRQLQEAPYLNKKIFIISDGQKSQFEELQSAAEGREDIVLTFIDAGEVEVQNTVIRSVTTSTNMIGANIPFTLNVEVANLGEIAAVNQFMQLQFMDEPAGQYPLSLQPGESQIFSFDITPAQTGSSKGLIQIEGDAFQADNDFYFTIQVPEKRNILWLNEEDPTADFISYTGAMLRAAGENDAQLAFDRMGPEEVEVSALNDYDAVILDGVDNIPEYLFQPLLRFVQNGSGLVFFPAEDGNMSNYNEFFSQFNAGRFIGLQGEYASFNSIAVADELLHEHPAFNALFEVEEDEPLRFTIPDIFYYLRFSGSLSGSDFNLMTLNNGDVLMREKKFGEGVLLISAIGNDPGWSNFPVKPLFAPFYYRILLYAAASDDGGFEYHQLGKTFNWTGNIDAENAVIRTDNDEIIPSVNIVANGTQLSYSAKEWTPGWITVADENSEVYIAANIERQESDFEEINSDELETLLNDANITIVEAGELNEQNLQEDIISSGFGKEVWHWFLLTGLLLLIAETLVSRLYKTDTVN